MKNVATVTSKGQITVPLDVRTHLGLREGDRVEFVTEKGVTVMRPSRGDDNPFTAFTGILGTFPGGIDEINTWVRDLRDDDERTG
jgi:AbrB family looped-hinge helix DNA binding protein